MQGSSLKSKFTIEFYTISVVNTYLNCNSLCIAIHTTNIILDKCTIAYLYLLKQKMKYHYCWKSLRTLFFLYFSVLINSENSAIFESHTDFPLWLWYKQWIRRRLKNQLKSQNRGYKCGYLQQKFSKQPKSHSSGFFW